MASLVVICTFFIFPFPFQKDLAFGVEHGVDVIFASFIRKARDVEDIKKELGEKGKHIWIISKVGCLLERERERERENYPPAPFKVFLLPFPKAPSPHTHTHRLRMKKESRTLTPSLTLVMVSWLLEVTWA